MYKFAVMLKTYRNDFLSVKRLLESFNKYNKDNIPLYVVLPEADKEYFTTQMGDLLKNPERVLEEEIYFGKYLDYEDLSGRFEKYMTNGYLNQQIVKLAFWECGLCENYFCIDSDSYFIRDFYLKDFMFDENTPYTILIEDNDLKADPFYYYKYWTHSREMMIPNIQRELEMGERRLLTCHGFQIFSAKVLEDFKKRYMDVNHYSYSKILEICALEFSWYNLWIQKEHPIPIHNCEPLFKTFHTEAQYVMTWLSGVETADLKRSYIGIVMNPKRGAHEYGKVKRTKWHLPVNRIPLLFRLIVNSSLYNIKTRCMSMVHVCIKRVRKLLRAKG